MKLPDPMERPELFYALVARRHSKGLPALPGHRIAEDRHLEMLRLRLCEGLPLHEIGQRTGVALSASANYWPSTSTSKGYHPPRGSARRHSTWTRTLRASHSASACASYGPSTASHRTDSPTEPASTPPQSDASSADHASHDSQPSSASPTASTSNPERYWTTPSPASHNR
jgi:hypothetical protein